MKKPSDEVALKRDTALARALSTPHKPHKSLKAKPEKKKGKK